MVSWAMAESVFLGRNVTAFLYPVICAAVFGSAAAAVLGEKGLFFAALALVSLSFYFNSLYYGMSEEVGRWATIANLGARVWLLKIYASQTSLPAIGMMRLARGAVYLGCAFSYTRQFSPGFLKSSAHKEAMKGAFGL